MRFPLDIELELDILPQPDETTCGPTCLQAVYAYYGDRTNLKQVIRETRRLETGGTYAAYLGAHALARGYEATIYTWNLQIFDPTWFGPRRVDLKERLTAQMNVKRWARLRPVQEAYLEYVKAGGRVRLRDLTRRHVRGLLRRRIPIITGLSSTYLYRHAREYGPNDSPDDIRGEPAGHFVVLTGYRRQDRVVRVSDPYLKHSAGQHHYWVNIDRLINAILLGTLTHDANLLIVSPRK